MRCPECGVWSRVLETRSDIRARECANGHRWKSQEVVLVVGGKPRLSPEQIAERNAAICADPRKNRCVADAHGMTMQSIRRIRANQ